VRPEVGGQRQNLPRIGEESAVVVHRPHEARQRFRGVGIVVDDQYPEPRSSRRDELSPNAC
jgi:hypothetical protein